MTPAFTKRSRHTNRSRRAQFLTTRSTMAAVAIRRRPRLQRGPHSFTRSGGPSPAVACRNGRTDPDLATAIGSVSYACAAVCFSSAVLVPKL
jgi:hypothetical protein